MAPGDPWSRCPKSCSDRSVVAADLLACFPDGVWFVELAPLDHAEQVGEKVAAVFGLPMHGERPPTLAIAAFLRQRRALLILDNCEHLIKAAAKLADTLLKTGPDVVVLATSREALSLTGEMPTRCLCSTCRRDRRT